MPVTATLMLDEEPVQDDGSLETELAILITSSNGELEALQNLSQEVDGDANMTTVSGELGHFSPLVAIGRSGKVTINGVPDSLPVGDFFTAVAKVESVPAYIIDTSSYTDESMPTVSPSFVPTSDISIPLLMGDELQRVFQISLLYSCFPEGKGLYRAKISLQGMFIAWEGEENDFAVEESITLSKGVTCGGVAPTPTPQPPPSPSPGPSPSPSPSPTPEVCAMLGVYTGNGGCGVNSFRIPRFTSSGDLIVANFKDNPGDLTFMKTDNPKVFKSARNDLVIFGQGGHTCTITCGPGNNQLTLECMRPGAVCQEVFTLQQ